LDRRLGGTQIQSGRTGKEKEPHPAGKRTPVVQSTASPYTLSSLGPHFQPLTLSDGMISLSCWNLLYGEYTKYITKVYYIHFFKLDLAV